MKNTGYTGFLRAREHPVMNPLIKGCQFRQYESFLAGGCHAVPHGVPSPGQARDRKGRWWILGMLDEFGGPHKVLETPKIYQNMNMRSDFRLIHGPFRISSTAGGTVEREVKQNQGSHSPKPFSCPDQGLSPGAGGIGARERHFKASKTDGEWTNSR